MNYNSIERKRSNILLKVAILDKGKDKKAVNILNYYLNRSKEIKMDVYRPVKEKSTIVYLLYIPMTEIDYNTFKNYKFEEYNDSVGVYERIIDTTTRLGVIKEYTGDGMDNIYYIGGIDPIIHIIKDNDGIQKELYIPLYDLSQREYLCRLIDAESSIVHDVFKIKEEFEYYVKLNELTGCEFLLYDRRFAGDSSSISTYGDYKEVESYKDDYGRLFNKIKYTTDTDIFLLRDMLGGN